MGKAYGDESILLPVIPLRGVVIFPHTVTPILVGRQRSIRAVEYASSADGRVFLVAQLDPRVEAPSSDDMFHVGTVAKVVQVMRFSSGMLKVLVEGETRARVVRYHFHRDFIDALVEPFEPSTAGDEAEIEALLREAKELFEKYISLSQHLPEELIRVFDETEDPNYTTDVICAQLQIDFRDKQGLLQTRTVKQKLNILIRILAREVKILEYKEKIERKVQRMMDDSQKEYFLRQQLEAIRAELGEEGTGYDEELKELQAKIEDAKLPQRVREVVEKEFVKLTRTPPTSPEAAVIRNYIDWLIELPWLVVTEDCTDIKKAEKILDEDHYGLEKIKERILEHIALMVLHGPSEGRRPGEDFEEFLRRWAMEPYENVLSRRPRGPILCLVGPPGVGKTSVAKSVARALGRKFVRASLGGLHDEAEIRGHRRTYVGALPGKIIQGLRRAGTRNPVFLLDEIDKIGKDFRGDPAAALMEVLDPDQNNSFMDNYIEIPFDLSLVMFITTANTIEGIPPPLLDRMEILRIPGYLENEKLIIGRDYLLPKQLKLKGLERYKITIEDDAFLEIIRHYTREAGVRELERQISAILRKIAVQIARDRRRKRFVVRREDIKGYLGVPKYVSSPVPERLIPGEALGLAWTQAGGELLRVEVLLIPGSGKTKSTGSLGDVMRESVEAAMSFVRSRAKQLGFPPSEMEKHDVHIHFPEGAVPKDGPSAGLAVVVALASALTGKSVPNDLAMTGEITLTGRVLPVGGLPEKLLAAKRYKVRRVIIPKENEKDLEEIKKEVLEGLEILPVSAVDDALGIVFGGA